MSNGCVTMSNKKSNPGEPSLHISSSGKLTGFISNIAALVNRIWKYRETYMLILPGAVWYILFAYIPMAGLMLAFKTYKANLGIWGSPWAGLENYVYVLRDISFTRAIFRTLQINAGRLIFQFPFPILLALAFNEVRLGNSKKILQTIFTFPQFLSWVIVSSILINVLGMNGMINSIIKMLGGQGISFLGNADIFQPMIYITEIWKSSGWSAIIYMAAISGIDQDQYEAAHIDGATRLQRIWHISLPGIKSVIVVMLLMAVGYIMNAGFDQVFNISNPATTKAAEILDMYIYRITFQAAADFSFSAAVSLFRSVINFVLLLTADRVAKLLAGEGLFA